MDILQIRNKTHSKGSMKNRNKIRHRLSDAKWRANLANCYTGLGRILINSDSSRRRKVTKASILKETINHIVFLENTIEALLREKAHFDGSACGPLPWESSLDYFRSNFLVHEKEVGKEISHDGSNFTNTISSQSVLPSTKLNTSNKVESIVPINSIQLLNNGYCIEDHCYHLTSSTYVSYLSLENRTSLKVICPRQNELNTSELKRGQKSNKEYNGGRRKPLRELNNIIMKTKTKKRLTQDYIKKCKTRIGTREKSLGIWNESTPLSRFWTSNCIFSSQATPSSSHYITKKYDIQSIIKPRERCEFINGVRRRIFSNIDDNAISYNRPTESTRSKLFCNNHKDILSSTVSKTLQYDSLLSDITMKKSITAFHESSFQSPFRDPNACHHCPSTPTKANKFKESLSQNRRIRTRRVLEKLMSKSTNMRKKTQENNYDNSTIQVNMQQDAELSNELILPQEVIEETSMYMNNEHFNNSKLSKKVLKAPVIMKVQKAIGSLQDKNHDHATDKGKHDGYLSDSEDCTLDYINSRSKETDFFKLEETNQEVPDNLIFHNKKIEPSVDVPHLPDIHCSNNSNIFLLLLCKNTNNRDQEVPKSDENFPYSKNQLNKPTRYSEKSSISPLCKHLQGNFDDGSTHKVPEIFHSLPEKLTEISNVARQDSAYEGMLQNFSHENSHNFLIQEEDPILTSANFTMSQMNLTEHLHKNCLSESPSKTSIVQMQHTTCQQTGCCWSPCQELSAATLFDTGYHETNE